MRHFSCDLCGKDLTVSACGGPCGRYVLRVEVVPAPGPAAGHLCEADLDQDHLDAMAEMLDDLEADGDAVAEAPTTQGFEFDLCPGCRGRYVADPLGRERVPKPRFSPN